MNYRNLHTKIIKMWGKASKCDLCNTNETYRYEWSNKDHKYSLIREKWWELCTKCHRKYDHENFPYDPWNKGKHIKSNDALRKYLDTHGAWNKGNRKRGELVCICGIKFYPPKPNSRFHSKGCATKSRYLKQTYFI